MDPAWLEGLAIGLRTKETTVDLWWFEGLKADLLFAGLLEEPVGEIKRSKTGKRWRLHCDLPGIKLSRIFLPRLEARETLMKEVSLWFGMANTSRPATDTDYE